MSEIAQRQIVLGSALVGAALCAYAFRPGEPPPAATPAMPAVSAAPAAPPPAPAPAPQPAAVPSDGLILYGVTGGGSGGMAAVIGSDSRQQRVVPVGRDYRPGLTLTEVGPSHAVLTSAGVHTRLELNRFAGASSASPSAPAPKAASAPRDGFRGMDVVDLRLGMAPHMSGGRINGFSLKPGADLAPLRQAGLRAGDVLVAVNGQAFDSSEKLMELPQEIAGSYDAEFEFERNGRRMKVRLPVNKGQLCDKHLTVLCHISCRSCSRTTCCG